MNILVVAAHPDDEVLGCGGTIARLSAEGHFVSILILSDGVSSRADVAADELDARVGVHYERARRAAGILGAREVEFAGFPDQRMDTLPLLDITGTIEKAVGHVRPEAVFTHHGGDLNMDHAIAFRATLTATRPVRGCCVKRLYSYEVASSTEWSFQQIGPTFAPQVFMDISAHVETKIAAMGMYESEVREYPHPRSPEALRAQCMRWGTTVGLPAAEAFILVREVG